MSYQHQQTADGAAIAATYSRRRFLRLAAVGASGGVFARNGAATTTPDRWVETRRWNGFRSVLRADDGYLAAGVATNADSEQVGWAVRVDADFEPVWQRTYQSPPHLRAVDAGEDHDGFTHALPDGEGGFLLVGWWHDLSPDSRYGWLVRIDARGWPRWSRIYRRRGVNSFRDDFAGGVRTDDGYLLVGRTIGGDFLDEESGDGWVVALHESGRIDWERAYDPQGRTEDGYADDDWHAEFSDVVRTDDGYLVVGEASPDGPTDSTNTAGWAVSIDDDGDVNWSRTYRLDTRTNNEFRDVVSTDDGYVLAGTAGEEEVVGELHDFQMRGQGWVLGVNERGRVRWEDDRGDAFHAVSRSAAGTLVAGMDDERGFAVEYDDTGSRTGRARRADESDSVYADAVQTPDGHLLVGHGTNRDDVDALLTELEDDGEPGDESEHVLEVVATERGPVDYEVAVEGTVERFRIDGRIKAEDNDHLSEDDGTVTVDGFTGNPGYGDAFLFTGNVVDFDWDSDSVDFFIRLDGEEVTADDLVDGTTDRGDSRLVEVVATEEGRVEYELVVDGDVEKARLNDRIKAEDNDHLTEDDGTVTVDGFTGNPGFGDAFWVTGDVVSFERTGGDAAFILRVGRQRVSVDELVD